MERSSNKSEPSPEPKPIVSEESVEERRVFEVYLIRKGLRHKARLSITSNSVRLESDINGRDSNYNFSVPCLKSTTIFSNPDLPIKVETFNKAFHIEIRKEDRDGDLIIKLNGSNCGTANK